MHETSLIDYALKAVETRTAQMGIHETRWTVENHSYRVLSFVSVYDNRVLLIF